MWFPDLPVCNFCKLTEQRTRCDVSKSEKQKCGLTLCQKCYDSNPQKQCQQSLTGCKKKVKQHRFRNYIKDKLKNDIKNDINSRFQFQSKFRRDIKLQKKYQQIDEDMSHILTVLMRQTDTVLPAEYKKKLDKLAEQFEKMKNTVESQIDRSNLPIFKSESKSKQPEVDNGMIACGYVVNDYSKGIKQILKSFF